jgi:glycosyltransferase involved in cell wall biosynthesis
MAHVTSADSSGPERDARPRPRLLYVVTEDWAFLLHRLPMARAARAAGFDVHVATNVTDGAAAIEREGFVLHPVRFARGRISPAAVFATIGDLRRIHRSVQPVLVHRVAVEPIVIDAVAALGLPGASVNALTGLGYAFIATSMKARVLRQLIGLVLRFLINRPRSVALVQNPDDEALVETFGVAPQRIVLIPGSGVDVERLRPSPEPEGPPVVGFVGRLLDHKGIRTLVAAHRLLRAKGLPIELLVAGTPDPANPASVSPQEVATWTHEAGITLLGHVADIRTVWARAHIAVLPSRREGLPKSLIEAAACGRPMVATDVPGCREVVRPDTGLLVPAADPAALARAIATLAQSPDLRARFGAAARALAVERFSADAIGHATVDLYQRIIDGSTRAALARAPS